MSGLPTVDGGGTAERGADWAGAGGAGAGLVVGAGFGRVDADVMVDGIADCVDVDGDISGIDGAGWLGVDVPQPATTRPAKASVA